VISAVIDIESAPLDAVGHTQNPAHGPCAVIRLH
jgi:hypothetical protein